MLNDSHKNNKRHDNLRASLKILKGLDSTPLDLINPKIVDSYYKVHIFGDLHGNIKPVYDFFNE